MWRGKVWQRYKGQRARALVHALELGHKVVVSMQPPVPGGLSERAYCATPQGAKAMKGYCTTSFESWDIFETWERNIPEREKNFFEVLNLEDSSGPSRPYADIDAEAVDGKARADDGSLVSKEEVLKQVLAGLIDMFRKYFNEIVETHDFVTMDASGSNKISFHVVLPNRVVKRLELKAALKLAKEEDPRLRFNMIQVNGNTKYEGVDLAPYGKTQAFRCMGSRKRGKNNALRPISACGNITLHPTNELTLRDFCASYTTGAERLLELAPGYIAAAQARRRGRGRRRRGAVRQGDAPSEDAAHHDPPSDEEEEEPPPADAEAIQAHLGF